MVDPNADKLSLCTVDVGKSNGGVKQIVCGADNFQAGDTVAVSLSGAVLENGLKLKKANLRGVESNGMIVAASIGDHGRPVLATFGEDVPNGAKLR